MNNLENNVKIINPINIYEYTLKENSKFMTKL